MDVNEFIKEELEKAKKEKSIQLSVYNENKQKFEREKELFYSMLDKFPEKTETEEKLEKAIGKKVEITEISNSGDRSRVQKFEYRKEENTTNYGIDYQSRFISFGPQFTGLINGQARIRSIIDTSTGEVIFENKYIDQPTFIQEAILFGVKSGLNELQIAEKELEVDKEFADKKYSESVEILKKIPDWIEQGEKLVYPERIEEWKTFVCSNAADNTYHGAHLVGALKIMNALEAGATIDQTKKIDVERYGLTNSIILHFSKRGPEFIKNAEPEYAKDYQETIEKIEKENKVFEQNTKSNIKK